MLPVKYYSNTLKYYILFCFSSSFIIVKKMRACRQCHRALGGEAHASGGFFFVFYALKASHSNKL